MQKSAAIDSLAPSEIIRTKGECGKSLDAIPTIHKSESMFLKDSITRKFLKNRKTSFFF